MKCNNFECAAGKRTSIIVSMMTAVTVCAVLAFMTVAPMSSPKLWATSVVSMVPSQLPKKAPAVSLRPPCTWKEGTPHQTQHNTPRSQVFHTGGPTHDTRMVSPDALIVNGTSPLLNMLEGIHGKAPSTAMTNS